MLVEREAELAAIEELLAPGTGGLLLIEGPAGIGKSALLGRAVASARERSYAVLRATGSELELEHAFGVALQLLEPPLARLPESEREALLAGPAQLAWPLLAHDLRGASPEAAFSVPRGLYWLAAGLAAGRPLLLCIDDLHWSDADSLHFLAYVAVRLDQAPIAVALSSRDAIAPADAAALDVMRRHPACRVLRPRALSADAVDELVARALPDAGATVRQACLRVSGGNPFLLGELLRMLTAAGRAPTAADVGRIRPERVQQSVAARLRALGPEPRRLAEAIAVLGDGAPLRLAARLAGLGVERAAAANERLAAHELTRAADPAGFVHPLVRGAVYDALGPRRREQAHARAARILADDGAAAEAVAAQLLRSGRVGDAWTAAALHDAARRAAASGAPAQAARYLRRALDEGPPAALRAEIAVALGLAAAAAGEPDAPQRLDAALDGAADAGARALILARLGDTLAGLGRLGDAARAYERGVEALDGADPGLAAELWAAFASVARIEPERQAEVASRIMPLAAHAFEEPDGGGRALLGVVAAEQALSCSCSRPEVVELARRALPATIRVEGAPFASVFALIVADAFEDAVAFCERALQSLGEAGSAFGYATAVTARAFALQRMGRADDALADALAAIDAVREGWEQHAAVAHAVLAEALIDTGDLGAAVEVLAVPDAEARWGGRASFAFFEGAQAHVALERGDLRAASDAFVAAGERALSFGARNPGLYPWRSGAARALAALGDRRRAGELVSEELRLAREFASPRSAGIALRARAALEPAGVAVSTLEEAVAALAGSPDRGQHAHALADLGGALRRAGQRRDCRVPLREAIALAEPLGQTALAERAHAELRAAGGRLHRRGTRGVAALTPSERRVCELAADGRTNSQIAHALFVTVRTVEMHLTNAYRKLDVDSRRRLPDALGRARD